MLHHRPHPRAFTLLELVLVLMLIAITLGIAAPSLRGFWAGARSRDAATQLLSVIQYARTQAISRGTVYRVNLDAQNGMYWLTVLEGEQFVRLAAEFGREFTVPEDMRLELQRVNETGVPSIDFHPNGRTEAAILRLIDGQNRQIVIACHSPAEPFRILTDEEVERL